MTDQTNSTAIWGAINSPDFQNRCTLQWIMESIDVSGEGSTVPSHNARLRYAGRVLGGMVPAVQLAEYVMGNSTIQAEVIADWQAGNPIGTSVQDNDILYQITQIYTEVANADAMSGATITPGP